MNVADELTGIIANLENAIQIMSQINNNDVNVRPLGLSNHPNGNAAFMCKDKYQDIALRLDITKDFMLQSLKRIEEIKKDIVIL